MSIVTRAIGETNVMTFDGPNRVLGDVPGETVSGAPYPRQSRIVRRVHRSQREEQQLSRRTGSRRASSRVFFALSTMLFVISVAVTIVWCDSMSAMGVMPMPGGWTMSMMWMRMPGQTWPGAAASFLAMWAVMMTAMMLPSLLPMLRRYRQRIAAAGATSAARLDGLTAMAALGYFFVWTAAGGVLYPLGMMLAELEMRHSALSRMVPFAARAVILLVGLWQFTPWKARALAGCLASPRAPHRGGSSRSGARRHGVMLGLQCMRACAGLMTILLVAGVMNLPAMAFVTAAITLERLAPSSDRAARLIGAIILTAGLWMLTSAIPLA